MPAAGYAKTIALDVIAQLAALNEATPLAVPEYEAGWDPMYVSDLDNMTPAGDPASQFQIVIAPVETKYSRTGWGGGPARVTVTLGILFQIAVTVADGEVTDPNFDTYQLFVDQVCGFLVGSRLFAGVWSASEPMVILGDHFNDHLFQKLELHVPVLVDFFADLEVS
jgi:hypothetical protein